MKIFEGNREAASHELVEALVSADMSHDQERRPEEICVVGYMDSSLYDQRSANAHTTGHRV
jgi:hypothetical protein